MAVDDGGDRNPARYMRAAVMCMKAECMKTIETAGTAIDVEEEMYKGYMTKAVMAGVVFVVEQ